MRSVRQGPAGPAAGLLLGLLGGAAWAETVDPEESGQRYAWSANAGWFDARPFGAGGVGLHVEAEVVNGWLWSPNVGWISAHCDNTASCADVDYGLRLQADPDLPELLRLSGTIWSSNAGWIVTDCAVSASCASVDYALRVDIASGIVDGWAWSENLGWIDFSCANTGTCATLAFGVQLDPAALVPPPPTIFAHGFE